MRRFATLVLLMISLDAVSQNNFSTTNERISSHSQDERTSMGSEIFSGNISGEIKTTDGQPAAFVTVYIRENNRTVITNEQ